MKSILAFLWDESGPTSTEYAICLALILAVCLIAVATLGTNANGTFGYVAKGLSP